ncbi:MAG TPA: sugar ABC transporter permease [Chloroflexia bacterium]|nr:sugar ABC transporter permease [Chloroflexia bacterium]
MQGAIPRAEKEPRRVQGLRLSPKFAPYVFVAPAFILFAVFMIYPIIYSFILSLQTNRDGELVWNGLNNYSRLLGDDLFRTALFNTFIILIVQVPIQLSLAMLLAVALNSQFLRGRGVFRAIYFLPAVTGLAAVSVIFRILFADPTGIVNAFLSIFSFGPIHWTLQPFWNRVLLLLAITWRWTGYNMVIYLSGLQSIPNDLYEAASVDGANWGTQFFRITLPLMRPIILFTTVLSTIGTLQIFDESYLLTNGGPENSTMTVGFYLYRTAFRQADFPYASTIAYGLLFFIAILSFLQFRFAGERDEGRS